MAGIQNMMNMQAQTPAVSAPGREINVRPKEADNAQNVKENVPRPEETAKKETEKAKSSEKAYENVVSVSEDGDTVQVSPEGEEELNGRVTMARAAVNETKPEENFAVDSEEAAEGGRVNAAAPYAGPDRSKAAEMAEEARKAAEEKKAQEAEAAKEAEKPTPEEQVNKTQEAIKAAVEAMQEKPSITEKAMEQAAGEEEENGSPAEEAPQSFAGMSSQQLEQLYLKGVISRYDYESEVESREAVREELNEEATAVNRQMNAAEAGMARAEAELRGIENAFGESAEDPRAAESRLEAMEALNTAMQQNQ